MTLRDDQRPVVSPDVLSRVLDGETVVLDLGSGTYFGLNEVATRVWELANAGTPVGDIRARLLDEFDVTPERVEHDLEELFGALTARGLLRLEDR